MDKSSKSALTIINGGRVELENRLIATFFTPYQPDNIVVGEKIEKQLKPRITPAALTLYEQEPPHQ